MVVKRRMVLPTKLSFHKRNKKDDYGVILGCRFYIKEIIPDSLASLEPDLQEGYTVLKINNTPVDGLSLVEAKRTLEKSKDKLILLVTPPSHQLSSSPPSSLPAPVGASANMPQTFDGRPVNYLNNSPHLRDISPSHRHPYPEDVNVYRPSIRSEEDLQFDVNRLTGSGPPPPPSMPLPPQPDQMNTDAFNPGGWQPVPSGAYPASQNTRYDGHYVLDNDLPPRDFRPGYGAPRGREPRDGYNSEWDDPRIGNRDYEDEVFPGPPLIQDLERRTVTFTKDKEMGLGLKLAGGNATGIFIASVGEGSEAQRQGLVEGDHILVANGKEITGLTREEAVSYLISLDGVVTMDVQYRKEEYDCIRTSNEAGDSFYVRVHFSHQAEDTLRDHSFKVGDLFQVKDTLFRGVVGGPWLAIPMTPDGPLAKKGTIPNSSVADKLKSEQQGNSETKENFPKGGKGSLFRKKSARRSKSLSKDHWEEVVFANLDTKFPAYERVVLQDPGFIRPIVILGAIADIAREKLLAEYPDKFEAPQLEKDGEKKGKASIIRLGAIKDVITKGKHCLLDVTPSTIDRLQYGQYCPMVILMKPHNRQAVKDVWTRWPGVAGGGKNGRKLHQHTEKLETEYSHLFTGTIQHMGTDAWFPKLVEMIDAQQLEPCWMSYKLPQEDMNEEFMFPMSQRFSIATGADSDVELPRPKDDFHLNLKAVSAATTPVTSSKPRLVRSSSDPSVNTLENIPGIPPYPSPPTYKNQRLPSHASGHSSIDNMSPRPYNRPDEPIHPEDRYYPSYYSDHMADPRSYAASRAHIDPYATLTPSEKLRPPMDQDGYRADFIPPRGPGPSYEEAGSRQSYPPPPQRNWDSRDYPNSADDDSYAKYVNSPQNKHDDSKLREKFGNLYGSGSDKGKSHDPYRFTRSTAHPVSSATVDRAKLSDLSAKYRRQDNQSKSKAPPPVATDTPPQLPTKKKEPPPVPAKPFNLNKQRSQDKEERKMRNYENSNRSYNYSDVNTSSTPEQTPPLPPPPSAASLLGIHPTSTSSTTPANDLGQQQDYDQAYEYMSLRNAANIANRGNALNDLNNLNLNKTSTPNSNTSNNIPINNKFSEMPPYSPSSIASQPLPPLPQHSSSSPSSTSASLPFTSYQNNSGLPPHLNNNYHNNNHNKINYSISSPQQQQQQHNTNSLQRGMSLPNNTHHHNNASMLNNGVGGGSSISSSNFSSGAINSPIISPHHHHHHHRPAATTLSSPSSGMNGPGTTNTNYNYNSINSNNGMSSSSVGNIRAGVFTNYDGSGGKAFANEVYMDQWDLGRARSSYDVRPGGSGGAGGADVGGMGVGGAAMNSSSGGVGGRSEEYLTGSGYRRPRTQTDDEQLRDLQLSRERARSAEMMRQNKVQGHYSGSPHYGPMSPGRGRKDYPQYYQQQPVPHPHDYYNRGHDNYDNQRYHYQHQQTQQQLHQQFINHHHQRQQQQRQQFFQDQYYEGDERKDRHVKTSTGPQDSAFDQYNRDPTPSGQGGVVDDQRGQAYVEQTKPVHSGASELRSDIATAAKDSGSMNAVEDDMGEEDGHTVIATAKGMFNEKGGLLESPETGVSILIPEGALGPQEQEIYFKVCQDNNLLPPLDTEKGETLLSPLVMCGPHGTTFKKPVQLRLPHSASSNPDNWSFALKSSDAPSGETTEWQNVTLAGSEGVSKGHVDKSSVSIMVDHF